MRALRLFAIAAPFLAAQASWDQDTEKFTPVDDKAILEAVAKQIGQPLAEAYQPKNKLIAQNEKESANTSQTKKISLIEADANLDIAVNVNEEVGPIWGDYAYVGDQCGDDEVANQGYLMKQMVNLETFPSHGKYGKLLTSKPHSHIAACMKKCQYVSEGEKKSPCTGVHFNEQGECVMHFMEVVGKEKAINATSPYGCYRRRDVPKRNFSAGYTHIGAGACISTNTLEYQPRKVTFNGPWSAMVMIHWCSVVCTTHDDCVAFTAGDFCDLYISDVAMDVSKTEKAFLQKPFGCYLKDSYMAKMALAAGNPTKELTQLMNAGAETLIETGAAVGGVKPQQL
uniref:Apple domain-containing protein n=1 Tax=Lotharella globosa TaxID=91324 RepID=A0A7S3Y9H7_9EUKA|mmetsp:Transcript_25085/g.49081  ORF Transcript_25085/g.49081 Transcript_25085/m.49081 type:complete len:341 (+) Transcript_25085:44-1066(+)